MIIHENKIYRFTIPFTKQVKVGEHILNKREGLILELNAEDGHVGYGEISPLPGRHSESLVDVYGQLMGLEFNNLELKGLAEIEVELTWLNQLHPSIRFGIESCCLNLLAKEIGKPPAMILTNSPSQSIGINGLFSGRVKDAEECIESKKFKKYPALKIKVGQNSTDEDITIIKLFRREFGRNKKIHLDGNRKFGLAKAVKFIKKIEGLGIEYFEEPLENPEENEKLFHKTRMPIGLDESMESDEFMEFWKVPGIKYHIIKPSIFGGLMKTLTHAKEYRNYGIQTVISSTYDSCVGLYTLSQLAAPVSGDDAVAGFGTDKLLAGHTTVPTFDSSEGKVDIMNWKYDLNYKNVELVQKLEVGNGV